jgi:hypothetical protein
LFDAAVHHKADAIEGVSERILVGEPIPLGTGLCDLLQQYVSLQPLCVVSRNLNDGSRCDPPRPPRRPMLNAKADAASLAALAPPAGMGDAMEA